MSIIEPSGYLYQHVDTGETKIRLPHERITDRNWNEVSLVLDAGASAAVAQGLTDADRGEFSLFVASLRGSIASGRMTVFRNDVDLMTRVGDVLASAGQPAAQDEQARTNALTDASAAGFREGIRIGQAMRQDVVSSLIETLRTPRPAYGSPGSRDEVVAAQQRAIDDAIAMLARDDQPAAQGLTDEVRDAIEEFEGAIELWEPEDKANFAIIRDALLASAGRPAAQAVVYPPDGTVSPFTVINLGSGAVQMGDCIHDHRLPALWFGKEGKGMGHEEPLNREAKVGETIAVVTFANVEGLDVLLEVVQRIRRQAFPATQSAPSAKQSEGAPGVGTVWQHRNGNRYTAIGILNAHTEQPDKYPVMVSYVGSNGRTWARRLDDWHRSMTLLAALSREQAQPVAAEATHQRGEAESELLNPAEPSALDASAAEVEALSFTDDRGLTVSETESMALVLHELKRLRKNPSELNWRAAYDSLRQRAETAEAALSARQSAEPVAAEALTDEDRALIKKAINALDWRRGPEIIIEGLRAILDRAAIAASKGE